MLIILYVAQNFHKKTKFFVGCCIQKRYKTYNLMKPNPREEQSTKKGHFVKLDSSLTL